MNRPIRARSMGLHLSTLLALVGAGLVGGSPTAASELPAADADSASGTWLTSQLGTSTVDSLKTIPWATASELLQPYREQAREDLETGLYDRAAARFSCLARAMPVSPQSVDGWFFAAIAHGRGGQLREAKQACDLAVQDCKSLLVVDYANPPDHRQGMPFRESQRDVLRRALRYRAELCKQAGELVEAVDTIRRFRAEEPEYHYLRKLLPLQAELERVSADALRDAEAAASTLSDQAKWAWERGDAEGALEKAEMAVHLYPNTGGATLARRTKAAVFWRGKRFDEARRLYQETLDEMQAIAPDCDLVREAAAKIAYMDCVPQIRSIIRRCQGGARDTVSPPEWGRVRSTCAVVMSNEVVPAARAAAHTVLIESYHFERRHTDVLAEAERFRNLHQNPGAERDRGYLNHILWVEYYAAWALLQLGRHDEAITHFRSVIESYQDDQDRWQSGSCLPQAYFGLWSALRAAGASPAAAKAQVAAFLEVFPANSYYATTIENAK